MTRASINLSMCLASDRIVSLTARKQWLAVNDIPRRKLSGIERSACKALMI
jgi:hypothetical protein